MENENQIELQININIQDRDDLHATVALEFIMGDSITTPFYICCQMSAKFKWDSEFPSDTITKMLNTNAASLILSYLRPIVASVTKFTKFSSIDIPFMDFRQSSDDTQKPAPTKREG